jgi:ribosomal-protein-alanine N-acetyltransferase
MGPTKLPFAPVITTERLKLERFGDADVPALAAILAEPEVAKNIVANASTPERCRASALYRINWHNQPWNTRGYGVWAVKAGENAGAPAGDVLGWCGFAEPDGDDDDPEILYGLAPPYWSRGLGQEAARAAINWLFAETSHAGVSAIIFGRLNPVSVALVGKLGMKKRGTMKMAAFLTDQARVKEVLDYEMWRLAHGACRDSSALLFQAPYKGGQFATLASGDPLGFEQAFCAAARARDDFADITPDELDRRVRDAFRQGMAEPNLDWFHVDRATWRSAAQPQGRG